MRLIGQYNLSSKVLLLGRSVIASAVVQKGNLKIITGSTKMWTNADGKPLKQK